MSGDFVSPKLDRLSLSDGRWIDVKHRLNAGERRRVYGRMVKEMAFGQKTTLDPEMVGLTRLVEYVVAWSMTDDSGRAVPVSEAAFDNLDPDVYSEMVTALDAHEERVEQERAKEKKQRDGASESSVISPSLSGVTGVSSGYVS